ncbi:hypothetical protein Lal_00049001, partial [Lupinus albus]
AKPKSLLHMTKAMSYPMHKIKLKILTPIIQLRNLDQYEELCNNTRLIVTKIVNHVLEVKIIYSLLIIKLEFFMAKPKSLLHMTKVISYPMHKIKLKVLTPIIQLRNLDQYEELCNNTILIVTKIANHVLEVKIIYIFIPISTVLQIYRKTIPCIYIYIMTINKSQGQSVESLRLYLPRRIFSHDQLYIVISRAKSKKFLKILIHDKDDNPLKSTNAVYKEVFQNL